MKRTVVFTSANSGIAPLLVEWIVSLRKLAQYSGEVMVMDYGLGEPILELLQAFDVRIIKCKARRAIVVDRYVDFIPELERRPDHVFAHFDADIWFQDGIDEIFEIAAIAQGCLFSADVSWYKQPYIGKSWSELGKYYKKIDRIIAKYGGTIQGGFSCGTGAILGRRFKQFREMLRRGRIPWRYGSDQYAFNALFDEDHDRAEFFEWNGIGSDTFKSNGIWWSKRSFTRKLRAIHVVGMLREETERRFRHCHRELFLNTLAETGLNSESSVHFDNFVYDTNVPNALRELIRMCRQHRGSAITLGKIRPPVICLSHIGCTGFVPNGIHGREHYWDRLKLARRDHIADPHNLYLSRLAVQTIAKIPTSYPLLLCRKFEDNFVDFMLTMMAAEHGLTIGHVLNMS